MALHYIALVILASLLSPADFGMVSLATAFVIVTQTVGELGIASALVWKKDLRDSAIQSAFWFVVAVGLLLAVATVLWADWLASVLLGTPPLSPVLQALAVIFPLASATSVPRALLQKRLRFDRMAGQLVGSEIAFAAGGLTAALLGMGLWSLVIASLAQRAAAFVLICRMAQWRPRLHFSPAELPGLLHFGTQVMFSTVLHALIQHLDYLIVGRWLGTAALGHYTLAFQLTVAPFQRLTGVFGGVGFAALSEMREQAVRLTRAYVSTVKYLFAIFGPLLAAVVVALPEFIDLAYDDSWAPVAGLVPILALAGFFYGLDIAQAASFATGRPEQRVWTVASRLVIFGLLAWPAVGYGVVGVAAAMTAAVGLTATGGFLLVPMPDGSSRAPLIRAVSRAGLAALCGIVLAFLAREIIGLAPGPVRLITLFAVSVALPALVLAQTLRPLELLRWSTGRLEEDPRS